MTPEKFAAIAAEGYNHIPVTRELLADLDTPLSCYVKVANAPYSYLLESAAQGGEKWSRYSMVGLPAKKILKVFGHEIVLEEEGVELDRFECTDPLEYVEQFQLQYRYPPIEGLPIYTGGLVGYFGYDSMRYVCLLYTSPSPRDQRGSRMPSSA